MTNKYKLTLSYENIIYETELTITIYEGFINYEFKHFEDINSCIYITQYNNGNWTVGTINKFDNEYNLQKCFINFNMKSTRALDLLVMTALAFIKKIDSKNPIVDISDMAINQYSKIPITIYKLLSSNPGTAYGKYGFRLKTPNQRDKFDSLIKKFLKDIKKNISEEDLIIIGLNKEEKITYEEYIRFLMKNAKDNEFHHSDWSSLGLKDIDINKTFYYGYWYLNWNFYNKIKDKVKIISIE
jgi:hypothetical protein